jgi:hypothetical protein
MELKYKSSSSEYHSGHGAGSGTIDTTTYYCLCGKGEIRRVKDNIPGFRDVDWWIDCPECNAKYHVDSHGNLSQKE